MDARFRNNGLRLARRLLPFRAWRGQMHPAAVSRDLLAGLTVAVVLIPQAMAYAMLAGLPAHYGLYAAAVTPAVAALWGSLRQLATGPIAILSLLVFTTLSPLTEPGSPRYVELALLLSLLVGGTYLLIGTLGLGLIMSFISHATVRGFTAAAALIIISTQLPHLLGLPVSSHESLLGLLAELGPKLPALHLPTLAVGAAVLVIIYGGKRLWPAFPAALVALVAATGAVYLLDLPRQGVAVVGTVPAGLPAFHLPRVDLELIPSLLGAAIVMALVAFSETYAVGKSISEQTGQKVDVNQEFIGQGLANLVGGLFQAYPVAGSFSRTAMNQAAGARTPLSSVFSAGLVLLSLLWLTPLFAYIPRAGLAALVISAVLLLFHPKEVFRLWRMNRHDGLVAVTVFALALVVKPDYALLLGIIVSLVLFLWVSMHPRIVRISWSPERQAYLNAEEGGQPCCEQMMILRIDNAIYFANAEYTVEQLIERVSEKDPPPRYLLLDFKGVGFVDITGVVELRRLLAELRSRDIGLRLVSLHQPVRRVFQSSGLLDELGPAAIHDSYHEAMTRLRDHLDHAACGNVCPYADHSVPQPLLPPDDADWDPLP
jgi:SulP family sulfate permease